MPSLNRQCALCMVAWYTALPHLMPAELNSSVECSNNGNSDHSSNSINECPSLYTHHTAAALGHGVSLNSIKGRHDFS